MAKVQKTYTREFREEAVRLAQTGGKPIAQIARELGISASAIQGWRIERDSTKTGQGQYCTMQSERRTTPPTASIFLVIPSTAMLH